MNTQTTLHDLMLIDFQKSSTRNDHASLIMKEFNSGEMGLIKFFSSLRNAKVKLNACLVESLKEKYKKQHLRKVLSRMIEVYLFRRFVLKNQVYDRFLEISKIPTELLEDLQKKYKKDNLENGLRQESVEILKGSNFDLWIRSTYLAQVSKIFKGVFGYKVNIRYVFNKPGAKQEWEERYFERYANFHWDQCLNSFTMIIYLSDVVASDGVFKVIKDSKFYSQNLYLSFYDRFVSDIIGLDSHICGDRVGSYIQDLPTDKELLLIGPAGTVIQFYGRHIVHDGGYPDSGGSRIALFVDQRNFLMKPLQLVSRLLAYSV